MEFQIEAHRTWDIRNTRCRGWIVTLYTCEWLPPKLSGKGHQHFASNVILYHWECSRQNHLERATKTLHRMSPCTTVNVPTKITRERAAKTLHRLSPCTLVSVATKIIWKGPPTFCIECHLVPLGVFSPKSPGKGHQNFTSNVPLYHCERSHQNHWGKGHQNFTSNVPLYHCERSHQNHQGKGCQNFASIVTLYPCECCHQNYLERATNILHRMSSCTTGSVLAKITWKGPPKLYIECPLVPL